MNISQTADPLELSQILTELGEVESAILLAVAWDVSPAYAITVHLETL